jgi:hypothetical protein
MKKVFLMLFLIFNFNIYAENDIIIKSITDKTFEMFIVAYQTNDYEKDFKQIMNNYKEVVEILTKNPKEDKTQYLTELENSAYDIYQTSLGMLLLKEVTDEKFKNIKEVQQQRKYIFSTLENIRGLQSKNMFQEIIYIKFGLEKEKEILGENSISGIMLFRKKTAELVGYNQQRIGEILEKIYN